MSIEKVLFVKAAMPLLVDDALEPDMGLLYVATYVSHRLDVQTVYVDLSVDSMDDLYRESVDAAICCFSTFTANYCIISELVHTLRARRGNMIFVAGGHHATALPEIVAIDFDYVIVGEGEIACLELISQLVAGTQPKERIIKRSCIENLDEIEPIDYSMVKMDRYTRQINGHKTVSILTSRGCPYHCEFCNSSLMKMYRSVRFRSARNVYSEMSYLSKRYGVRAFRIQDDIFSINKERLRELSELLSADQFELRCFARIDNLDHELLSMFSQMGICHTSFGVESGSQKILDLMNKGLKVNDIRRNMRLVRDAGITSRVFLIAGYPGETYETLDETIQLIKEIKPDEVSVYPLIPYPGTPLYAHPEKYGITYIDRDFSKYYQIYGNKESGYVFETESVKLADLKNMRDYLVDGIGDVCPWAIDIERNR